VNVTIWARMHRGVGVHNANRPLHRVRPLIAAGAEFMLALALSTVRFHINRPVKFPAVPRDGSDRQQAALSQAVYITNSDAECPADFAGSHESFRRHVFLPWVMTRINDNRPREGRWLQWQRTHLDGGGTGLSRYGHLQLLARYGMSRSTY